MMSFIKSLLGIDPILLDVDKRTKQLEATINGESEWFLVCRPLMNHTPEERIECNDREIYIKQVMKEK
jgi:hypothetical protein